MIKCVYILTGKHNVAPEPTEAMRRYAQECLRTDRQQSGLAKFRQRCRLALQKALTLSPLRTRQGAFALPTADGDAFHHDISVVAWQADGMLKFLSFLYRQRVRGFDPPSPEPFMDSEGTARFKQELNKATSYLEYGSGGTTLLADQRNIPGISVENDRFYARAVAAQLKGSSITQVVVATGPTREWGFPLFRSLTRARAYTKAGSIARSPDFILIDGRWRVACALESAQQAKLQGRKATLMFDDYAGRPHYHRIERLLGEPEMTGRAAIFQIGHQDVRDTDVEHALLDSR